MPNDSSTPAAPGSIVLAAPDAGIVARAQALRTMCEGYVIDSPDLAEAASDDLRSVADIRKALEDERVARKRPIIEAGRAIDDHYREPLAWLADAERALKSALLGWKRVLDERAAEERRKQEAELAAARRLAEEEAARKRAEIEAEAARLKETGATQLAAVVERAAAAIVPAAAPMPTGYVPTTRASTAIKGTSSRSKWNVEIVDKAKLVARLLETGQLHLIEIPAAGLLALAKATNGTAFSEERDGVRAWSEETLAVGRRSKPEAAKPEA